jgi:hypothetical protein
MKEPKYNEYDVYYDGKLIETIHARIGNDRREI